MPDAQPVTVLVLYDSRAGLVRGLAAHVCAGAREIEGVEVLERTVDDAVPADLLRCDSLIVGSPNWSGVSGRLKT